MINIIISFSTFIVLCSHVAEVLCELGKNVTVDFGSLNKSGEHPQHICFTVWLAAIAVTFCVLKVDGEADKIHSADRQAIKQHIVGLMLKSPERVQNQVCWCVYIYIKCSVSLWGGGAEWLHRWIHASVNEVSSVTL